MAFCLLSLDLGYAVPRALGVAHRQAIASGFEIGVHNGTLAIAVAISVLDSVALAVPAAVYSVVMFPMAAVAGWLITRAAPAGPDAAGAGRRACGWVSPDARRGVSAAPSRSSRRSPRRGR